MKGSGKGKDMKGVRKAWPIGAPWPKAVPGPFKGQWRGTVHEAPMAPVPKKRPAPTQARSAPSGSSVNPYLARPDLDRCEEAELVEEDEVSPEVEEETEFVEDAPMEAEFAEEAPMEAEFVEAEFAEVEEETEFAEDEGEFGSHYATRWASEDDPYDMVVAPEGDVEVGQEWVEEEIGEEQPVEEAWPAEEPAVEEAGRPDWSEVKAQRVEAGWAPRGGIRVKLASLVFAVADGAHPSSRGGESALDIARGIMTSDDRIFSDVERLRRTARRWDQAR